MTLLYYSHLMVPYSFAYLVECVLEVASWP